MRIRLPISTYGELVMFSHSIFSFSFTIVAACLAARGFPGIARTAWIVLAFLGGRTCANALNRIVDRNYDAANPRTAGRHLPRGTVSVGEAAGIALVSFVALALAAFMLNPLCVILLPVAGILFIVYSYTKRFTWLCHGFLGVTCAGASMGGWIAVTGRLDFPPFVLAAANALWVAGFDIIYGIQDIDFDRGHGLHSIPERFGPKIALLFSSLCHAGAVGILAAFGLFMGLGWLYYSGIVVSAVLLGIEQRVARKGNPDGFRIASYSINQVVSIVFMVFTLADIALFGVPSWPVLF